MMFAFKPVLLWTDQLIFLLIAVVLAFAWYTARREHLRAPWRKVARSAGGMVGVTILSFYVVVGLLDSLHYQKALPTDKVNTQNRYAPEVLSVLDSLCEPLRKRQERTFSAPFAVFGHAKENLTLPDGTPGRDYPRLKFAGAHLKNPAEELGADIVSKAIPAIALAAILWAILVAGITALAAKRNGSSFAETSRALWSNELRWPLRAMFITLGCMLIVLVPMITLSAHYHVLGTDKVGQDVFYLSLKSVRTALIIGTLTTLLMLPFALLLGIMAGYFKGWVDDVVQYIYTTLHSIPGVLLIAAAVLMMQVYMDNNAEIFDSVTRRADFRLLGLCAILGVTSWTSLCRLLRGETLKLRELDFVQAAQAFGVSPWRIMLRHLMPNVIHLVIITVVLGFSGLVLSEAVLSYVGVGVDPAMNSFGTMINAARLEMAREPIVWWSLAAAFGFMLLLVLAANLFADAVRDALDPRVRSLVVQPGMIARMRELRQRRRAEATL